MMVVTTIHIFKQPKIKNKYTIDLACQLTDVRGIDECTHLQDHQPVPA